MNATPTQPGNLTVGAPPTAQAGPAKGRPATGQEPVRWSWADAGLWAVACSGFALSYSSVQKAALSHVDHEALSYLLPVATDGGALAAAVRYVADRRAGVAGARGWQLLAWAAIAASAALNAMGRDWQDAVWHLVGPGALAVITELYAHRAARLRKKEEDAARESIPARLWLTSPRSSFRLWLWTARTDERSLVEARQAMDRYAAAREALEVACRSRADRRIRDLARDQLRSGVLAPAAVLQVLGWGTGHKPKDAADALRMLLATDPGLPAPADQTPANGGPTPTVEVHVINHSTAAVESHQVESGPVDRSAIEFGPVIPAGTGRLAEPAEAAERAVADPAPAGPAPVLPVADRTEADRATGPQAGPVDGPVDGPDRATDRTTAMDRRTTGPVVRLVTDRAMDRANERTTDRSATVARRTTVPAARSGRVDRTGGEDRAVALLPKARRIADGHLAKTGRPIARRPLAKALRAAGETCSTDTADTLLELLAARPQPAAEPHAQPQASPQIQAEAEPVVDVDQADDQADDQGDDQGDDQAEAEQGTEAPELVAVGEHVG